MTLEIIGSLLGGLGLFMLGMHLMTDGLKLAAGNTLRSILAESTRTSWRGLISGALITSLVQSSSAVTVATIGFVNAGLMKLRQAVTVIYGSNIGTTMTGWLVSLVGFQVDIRYFALPAIGLGMLLRFLKKGDRAGGFGWTMTGFGIFFVGIDILKETFGWIGTEIDLAGLAVHGPGGLLLFIAVGFFLTVLMQSSSASLAIALAATAGGVITLFEGAAVVIGANVGTTSTTALAVLDATPNARRVAAAHVMFNVITGVAALLVMPLLFHVIFFSRETLQWEIAPASVLALFHTTFNILGVMLLWPFTDRLVRRLQKRFRSIEEDESRPVYLDRNVVNTPVLALQALAKELSRFGAIARRMAKGAMSSESGPGQRLHADRAALEKLEVNLADFVNLMQRGNLPAVLDDLLPNALRVSDYYMDIAANSEEIARLQQSGQAGQAVKPEDLAVKLSGFKGGVVRLLEAAAVEQPDFAIKTLDERMKILQEEYKGLKAGLLKAGARDELPVTRMVALLDLISNLRRVAEQAEKAARYLSGLLVMAKNGLEHKEEAERS